MTITQISKNFWSAITPLQSTKKIYIQYFTIEVYKIKNGLPPVIMNDVFQFGKNFVYDLNFRGGNHLQRTNIQTVNFGSESIKTLGAKIWVLIPAEVKASKSIMIFKKYIKNWTPKSCLCRLFAGSILAKLAS